MHIRLFASYGLVILGALLLAVTAYFHFTGLTELKVYLQESRAGFFKDALPAVWLLASLHWTGFGIMAVVSIFTAPQFAKKLLFGIGFLLIADAILMYSVYGPFIGELILFISGALFIIYGIINRGKS